MTEKKFTYNFSNDPEGVYMLIAQEIASDSKVLDIGCASGYMGEFLVQNRQCELWGIEPDHESFVSAKEKRYKVILNDTVETGLANDALKNQKFDYIILADVLEHLLNPEAVLQQLHQFLTPGGKILISLPNVGHYSTRFTLLFGNWNMKESGILDRTHLHFYTLKTARELIENNGYVCEKIRPRGDLERWFGKFGLKFVGRFMLFLCMPFFAVQFIIVARPK